MIYTTDTEVVAEIERRLGLVRTANGYATDLGREVFDGKVKIEDSDVPCVSIVEAADNVESRAGKLPTFLISTHFALVAYVPCDPAKPNVAARAAVRDMRKAIFADGGRFGGKVHSIDYRGRQIGLRPDGAAVVQAILEIDVQYVEQFTE